MQLRDWAMSSYLSKVSDIKEVEGLKQLTFPHTEGLVARHQECPDVLQAQKLLGRRKRFIHELKQHHITKWLHFPSDRARSDTTLEDGGSRRWIRSLLQY